MPPVTRLSAAEIASALAEIPGWSVAQDKLHREYRFSDFATAFAFMTAAALRAEAMNHHPEWFNVYSRVTVDLTTHDAGGISKRDFELARKLDKIAEKLA